MVERKHCNKTTRESLHFCIYVLGEGISLKPVFFSYYSIVALLCRFKAQLHTCTIWMDPSLSIPHLFLRRYVLSIMIFISYSYSPKEIWKLCVLMQEGLIVFKLFSINDFLRKYFSTLTTKFLRILLVDLNEYSVWVCPWLFSIDKSL